MKTETKYRLIALGVTFVVAILVVAWLMLTEVGYSSIVGKEWPPKPDTTALLLADEYVEVEMIEPPVQPGGGSEIEEGATPPPPEANDLVNEGPVAQQPAPVVTSTQPSPVKVKSQPVEKPTGPSQAEIDAARAKEKREREAREQAVNRWNRGATSDASGSGDGTKGDGQGNSDQKSNYKGSGSGTVGGRGISVGSSVSSSVPGTVTVRISVSPEGKVLSAELGSPTTIADPAVRQRCVDLARKAKIPADPSKTKAENGRISFVFK